MVGIIQNIFSSPEKFIAGKKVVILQMGTVHMYANIPWNDITVMDDYQKILVGTKNMESVVPEGKEFACPGGDAKSVKDWKQLPDRQEFLCRTAGPMSVADIPLKKTDLSKKMVCVATVAVFDRKNIRMNINGVEKKLPVYDEAVHWQNVVFELPAGTKNLHISAQGPENGLWAIRNIMIYQ